jgi:branched-chain amino acid transport system ATP-binding protein
MLRVEGLDFSSGPVRALEGVSLELAPGEIVALLGANGAGKTTLLSLISGLESPRRGRITLDDRPIGGLKPSLIVGLGVVQVPEGRQIFGPLSVEENLLLGAYCRRGRGQRPQVAQDLERVYASFPALGPKRRQPAGNLSGGEQQMVAMGRALMARPRYLLLDEPSLGLAPLVTREIFEIIKGLPAQGCGVLLVEQNALGALTVAQRGYVLTNGAVRFAGAAGDILADELLREAFLGPENVQPTRRCSV